MKFDTTRFGNIDVEPEAIIIFRDGPLGFPDYTKFTLIDDWRDSPFRVLQSLDNPALAFEVVDPLIIDPDYHFNLSRDDLKLIQAETMENLKFYAIVMRNGGIQEATLNLQGPLIINRKRNLGHQFVLIDTGYSISEKLYQQPEKQQNLIDDAAVEWHT